MLNIPTPLTLQRTVESRGVTVIPYGHKVSGNRELRLTIPVAGRGCRGCKCVAALRKSLNGPVRGFRKEKSCENQTPLPPRGPPGSAPGHSWALKPRQVTLARATTLSQKPHSLGSQAKSPSGPRTVGHSVRPFRKVPVVLPVPPEAASPWNSGLSVAGGDQRWRLL